MASRNADAFSPIHPCRTSANTSGMSLLPRSFLEAHCFAQARPGNLAFPELAFGRAELSCQSNQARAAAFRKCSTRSFAGRGRDLKLREQITRRRLAQESRIRIIASGMVCAQRRAAASGTTATPTLAAAI